jgi:MFS family permease
VRDWLEIDLRPLQLGELLDRAFVLYRHRFVLFVGILLLPHCILLVGNLLVQAYFNPVMDPRGRQAMSPSAAAALASTNFLLLILYLIVYIFALGAATCAISDVYLNRPMTIRGAYGKLKGRVGSLIGLFFALGTLAFFLFVGAVMLVTVLAGAMTLLGPAPGAVAAILGSLGVIVVAVWVLLRFALAVPVVVLERTGVFESLHRSSLLTRGLRGKVFVAMVLVTLLAYNALILIQGPFAAAVLWFTFKVGATPFWLAAANAIAGTAGSVLSGPFVVLVLALFYYDARVRKEALDIRLLLAKAEGEALPQAAASAPPVPGTVSG